MGRGFAIEIRWFSIVVMREALPPRRHLGRMPNLPIPHSHFCVPPNLNANPITRFSKAVHHNMVAPLPEHINEWKSILHMDGYYVMGVTTIPYHGFGCILTIVSKENMTYLMSICK